MLSSGKGEKTEFRSPRGRQEKMHFIALKTLNKHKKRMFPSPKQPTKEFFVKLLYMYIQCIGSIDMISIKLNHVIHGNCVNVDVSTSPY